MKKIFFATLVALAAFATACKDPEDGPKGGSEVTADLKADAAFVDGKANVQVVLSAAAEAEVKATLAIASDSQLKDVTVEPSTVVIPAGQTTGKAVLTLASGLEPGEYTVKLGMTVTGAKAGTDVVTVKAVVEGPEEELPIVLNFYNYKMHCNPKWTDKPIASGSNYTMEVKFYSTHWHNYGQKEPDYDPDFANAVYCNRLAQFCNGNEYGFLYRFGDGGEPGSLRLNSKILGSNDNWYVGGQKRVWATDMWHTVTVAVDAETCHVYDNGELIEEKAIGTDAGFDFERYEFGMSWDDGYGYPRAQDFHGYLAYIRFWTKTLSEEEIKAGLCHVDHHAEGLAAMWEFNQDGGAIVPDVTGGGRDWNFADVYDGDGRKIDVSEEFKAQWFDWDEDEMGPLCPDFSAVEE